MGHAYNMYYSGCTGTYNQDRYGYGERYALCTGLTGASSNPHCTCYCPHSSSHFCNHDKVDCVPVPYMTALYLLFRGYINERMFVNLYALSALSPCWGNTLPVGARAVKGGWARKIRGIFTRPLWPPAVPLNDGDPGLFPSGKRFHLF
jgi:hypothetical protein